MKIPEHAKAVYTGKIYTVYEWEQELFDGTTATFEGIKRKDTVLTIPTRDNTILLSYEEQPLYPAHLRFFGGRIEDNEEPLASAQRELIEETGMVSDDWILLKRYNPEPVMQWNLYVYIARNVRKEFEPSPEAGEKIEVKSYSFNEFIKMINEGTLANSQIGFDIHRMTENEKGKLDFKNKLFSTETR